MSKKANKKIEDVSGESETPKTTNSPVDIVSKRLVDMPGSISKRLGQILTTTKRANTEEKKKIDALIDNVHTWVNAIQTECKATKTKATFGLSEPETELPVSAQSGDLQ